MYNSSTPGIEYGDGVLKGPGTPGQVLKSVGNNEFSVVAAAGDTPAGILKRAALPGVVYSVLTGICVGAGTVMFFLLFQKGGPLSAVPMVLAGGAALMALAGILFFKEPASWPRLLGIVLSIVGLFLLRLSPAK